jgi:hypothetical protein
VKDEKTQKLHLIAIQTEPNAEILIFTKFVSISINILKCDKYAKYSECFIGIVERNYWGTSFNVYDDGFPEDVQAYFPEWIGSKRKKLMQIEYETNILASEPRKFDTAFLNFDTKKFESMKVIIVCLSIDYFAAEVQQRKGLLLTTFFRV